MKAIKETEKSAFQILKGNNEPTTDKNPILTVIVNNSSIITEESDTSPSHIIPEKQDDKADHLKGYLRYQRFDFF